VTRLGDGSFDQGDDLTREPGTGSEGNLYPIQTALCVSFSSARQDASGKGRCFLPFPRVGLGSDWRLPESGVTPVLTAMRTLATQLRQPEQGATGDVWGTGRHAVISSKGTTSVVTQYRVGRVPDTMRSRRNALPEAYVELDALRF
jgi:hypothetical protein